jgi:hypothetical protein
VSGGHALLFGDGAAEHVRVHVVSRAYPGGLFPADRDLLYAELAVRTRAKSFRYGAFLRARDFARFRDELAALAAGTEQTARLAPADPWLVAHLTGAAPGWRARVIARDNGSERVAELCCDLDAGGLALLQRDLAALVDAYPPQP